MRADDTVNGQFVRTGRRHDTHVVEVEPSGLKGDGIDIEISERELRITGEHKEPGRDEADGPSATAYWPSPCPRRSPPTDMPAAAGRAAVSAEQTAHPDRVDAPPAELGQ
ncbi:Hsp20/alpha crystallin family protein [Streptomyces sp. NPDC054833]